MSHAFQDPLPRLALVSIWLLQENLHENCTKHRNKQSPELLKESFFIVYYHLSSSNYKRDAIESINNNLSPYLRGFSEKLIDSEAHFPTS